MKRELFAFLQEMGRIEPLLLFLDDLHWADVSTVDLLAYLGSRCAGLRLFIVLTYRPSDLLLNKHPFLQVKLELQSRGVCRELGVEFLSREDIQTYLALQFSGHRFPAEFATLIHAQTEGNPLFMVDLLHYLQTRGVITEEQGQWTLAQAVPAIQRELPESVRSMIQRKIEQLGEAERRLAGGGQRTRLRVRLGGVGQGAVGGCRRGRGAARKPGANACFCPVRFASRNSPTGR